MFCATLSESYRTIYRKSKGEKCRFGNTLTTSDTPNASTTTKMFSPRGSAGKADNQKLKSKDQHNSSTTPMSSPATSPVRGGNFSQIQVLFGA